MALIAILFISSCSPGKPSVFRKAKPLMDTFVIITVMSDSEEKADQAIDDTFARIGRFGDLINFYSDTSELALINTNAGVRPVRVSADTISVIEKALLTSRKSDGAFDATIGPVMKLWDFHQKIAPEREEVLRKLPLVDYRNVVLDRDASTVFLKKKGMLLDLGGVAKGYAADLAVKNLREKGIPSALVAIAGDIRAYGAKPDGRPWKVGVKNPRQQSASDEIIATLDLLDRAISTSGDYERSFIRDGQRFHHLLDPKTGFPAGTLMSVSVIAEDSVLADAFSTAVFILGRERGMEVLREMGMEAIIIDSHGTITATPGIRDRIEIEKKH